ncbi:hypothetical protein ACFSCX_06925 [Bacillus salitolerans]|uniref:Uncharacterized protein n=1 Tax=Bacillus salitolerans TaxID=1437434 RepID=A0ABW4LNM1_9BACI
MSELWKHLTPEQKSMFQEYKQNMIDARNPKEVLYFSLLLNQIIDVAEQEQAKGLDNH